MMAFFLLPVLMYSIDWSSFCERHLVAADPYQFRGLSIEQIVNLCVAHRVQKFDSKELDKEVQLRLSGELSYEEREWLKVCL